MPRYLRFKDDTDFEDRPHFSRSSGPAFSGATAEGRRPPGPPPQRTSNISARAYPVDKLNEATVINRRSADALLARSAQGRFDVRPQRPRMSVALSQSNQASHQRRQQSRLVDAKALAADARQFNPNAGFPKTIYGTYARTEAGVRGKLRFLVPSQVVPCIQRTTRREVLFATKRAGGGASRKPKRRTFTSNIGC